MNKKDFEFIIEKVYLILKNKFNMDDIQAVVVIASVVIIPISYFLGIGYIQISLFRITFFITIGLDLLTIIYSIVKYKYFQNKRLLFIEELEKKIESKKKIEINSLLDLRQLNGFEFEIFAREFFKAKGYIAKETQFSHDHGADVIAWKDNEKYVIQAKLYSKSVNKYGIYQTHHAMKHYKADHAILFTSSDTNNNANDAAKVFNVKIINGHDIDLFLRKNQSIVIDKSSF